MDKHYFMKSISIAKHKVIDTQLSYFGEGPQFSKTLKYTTEKDHAGFHFEITLFHLMFSFNIIDTRHWNKKKKCWE